MKRFRKSKRRSESLDGSDCEVGFTSANQSGRPKYNERFVGSPATTKRDQTSTTEYQNQLQLRPLCTSLNNLPGSTSTPDHSSDFSDDSSDENFQNSDFEDFSRKISSPVSRAGSFSMRSNFYSQQASPILTRKRSLTASQVWIIINYDSYYESYTVHVCWLYNIRWYEIDSSVNLTIRVGLRWN